MCSRLWKTLLALTVLAGLCVPALAGSLWKQDIERMVGPDYVVGEIQSDLPVYPLYLHNPADPDAKPELKAYAFETNDLTSVRGYSGKPLNILVVMDLNGNFLAAQLLEQKEPLFVRDDDVARLHRYIKQHVGLSLRHTIEVGKPNDTPSHNEHAAHLRGIHTGTITAQAITRTIVSAAANVALARLKLAGVTPDNGKTSAPAALPPATLQSPPSADPARSGAAGSATTTTSATSSTAADKAGDTAAGKASIAAAPVPPPAINVTTVLSTPPRIMQFNAPGKRAPATGAPAPGTATAPSAPGGANVPAPAPAAAPATAPATATDAPASLPDDGTGTAAAPAPTPTLPVPAPPPALQAAGEPDWLAQWASRGTDIAILLSGLALLSAALLAQRRFSASAKRLRVLRTLYLLFTVGFIGWYVQGQLTIVNITSAIESLTSGGTLEFLMNDPMTVILWIFVGITLLVWGRGTFCGWLCPFGALQELISLIANAVGLRQRRLRAALDAQLKRIKYVVLAVIIGAVFIAPEAASWAVEVEPFKTAISLYFDRSWPYVLWAAGCLALTVFIYRGYCRYVCPLGAALASVGFLRRWSWIARRTECGTPCQSCRHRCEYQAIEQSGKINYRECFQCLDCVSIYQDEHRCLPLIVEKKRAGKVIPVHEIERV